ncbi:thermonuclease family protein [Candidatus Saccharibacteria bacterium]|nr:thermonuclease family protein [Candidatus Saccharibacteria bacterium]
MQKRQKKQLIGLVLFAIVLFVGPKINGLTEEPVQRKPVPAGFYAVTDFNDGDTVTVDMSGRQEKIRFIGVDTPETQDPRKAVQCFGKAASKFTKDLIGEQAVRLEADPLNTNRDRYNRLLRYIYLPDGRLVNAEIIAQGYGFAYTSFPFTKADEFRALQTTARTEERGLWKSCTPEQNKYGGYTSNAE